MNSVRRAGKRLAKEIIYSDVKRDEILHTFDIANSWRDSHVYPMKSVRFSVLQHMRHAEIGGFTAARPKSMASIRTKLRRLGCQLDQINDLAGCRAVVDDIEGVDRLISVCRDKLKHTLRQEYDYINAPKEDGYRSHHFVFLFNCNGERRAFNGRRVEVQIRTRLQHAWATAVEAVGLFRGEDMKAGHGNLDWLRLFQLMSAEFAYTERCTAIGDTLSRHTRVGEIRELASRLKAIAFLDDLKNATHYVQRFVRGEDARYYLVRYDHRTNEVTVEPKATASDGMASVGLQERRIELESDDAKVVLLAVDKVDQLAEAYPNYFGDVSLFIKNLKASLRAVYICLGQHTTTVIVRLVFSKRCPRLPLDEIGEKVFAGLRSCDDHNGHHVGVDL